MSPHQLILPHHPISSSYLSPPVIRYKTGHLNDPREAKDHGYHTSMPMRAHCAGHMRTQVRRD